MAALVVLHAAATAWLCTSWSPPATTALAAHRRVASAPRCALDMNDPAVAEEYAAVMTFDTEQIEDELAASGIVAPSTMNDFELRSMLVEMRMMKNGKGAAKKPPPKPASYANDFEKALYEKPAVKALYEEFKNARLQNEINLVIEYINDKKQANERYGGTPKYEETVGKIEAALNAKVVQVVTTGRLYFSGFPSNMGEQGVKMTLESFGPLKDFSCEESEDGMSLTGRAEYDDVDAAKAAIYKYDGVDMGLGTTLELQAL